MSALRMARRVPARRVVVLLVLATTAGLGVGWFLLRDRELGFDYLYALLAPALIAIACAGALTARTNRHRWLVPVFLALAIVNVTTRPHVPTLSALSIAAAALATIAALADRRTTALFLTLVACVAISASLFFGLRTKPARSGLDGDEPAGTIARAKKAPLSVRFLARSAGPAASSL